MAHWPTATRWLSPSGCASLDESDLVRAARQGDKSAFQQLIFQYDRLVLTFALNVTQSEENAKQIYERVFLKAFSSLPAHALETSLFVWIYRIAANCCQQFLLDESREKRQASRVHRSRHSYSATPAASAVEKTSAMDYRFSQLSARERVVFVLAHFGHLRATTIAEILELPEISVKEALMRAVYKLSTSAESSA
jgi:RNA polymerase sigma-70 factor (ECF subfamily)